METIFSHRPLAGVSVGACNSDSGDTLFIAFALVNDGTSRSNLYEAERQDNFCRNTARNIIRTRLESLLSGNDAVMTLTLDTSMSARDFMKSFRETFKPTVDETDDFLNDIGEFSGVEVRYRASDIVVRVTQAVHEVIANASASV